MDHNIVTSFILQLKNICLARKAVRQIEILSNYSHSFVSAADNAAEGAADNAAQGAADNAGESAQAAQEEA